ncbi:hypothetical protein E1202_26685 [Saccharopolyspora karakumensis]|uniref:Uncharacterized protein n=1 Tax=Saccharopolyspora karakumensis TaxID=2530386 RepID=A0A4R5BD76_9PSEU|nr:hypothetical protein [Saccharopolyspora karakumensis]TDD82730.1 hypothetical protein E1202_26685 [Saccharopolyspora karakumensis]
MKQGPQIATAVAIGYALGRSRRMKLALMVGGVVLGRRMGDPKELLAKAGEAVPSGEAGSALRDRLVEAAKAAAVAAASNEIETMSDNLSERAAKLRSPQSGSSESGEDEQESASSEEPETPKQRSSTEDDEESASEDQESGSEDDQASESNKRTRAPRTPSAPRAATPGKKTSAGSSSGSNRRSGGNDG